MQLPVLHFELTEYAERLERTRASLKARGLDGVLLFSIEDMYWLTGLDSDGFYVFHCLYVGANGHIEYLTRRVDGPNVSYSSIIEHCRFWDERAGAGRGDVILRMLQDLELGGKRVGLQLASLGMRADLYLDVQNSVGRFCELVPASDVVGALRRVKSPAELAYMRKAATICEEMRETALKLTRPGKFDKDIFAELAAIPYRHDGDPSALRWPGGAGAAAFNQRYYSGRNRIMENDRVTFEIGCGYRHYHAAIYFIALTGPSPNPRNQRLHEMCLEILEVGQAAMRPGNVIGDIHDAARRVYEKHGFGHSVLKSLGYNMGATFPPTWVDQPMITEGQDTELQEGMVLFFHPTIHDHDADLCVALAEQAVVWQDGVEKITSAPKEIAVV